MLSAHEGVLLFKSLSSPWYVCCNKQNRVNSSCKPYCGHHEFSSAKPVAQVIWMWIAWLSFSAGGCLCVCVQINLVVIIIVFSHEFQVPRFKASANQISGFSELYLEVCAVHFIIQLGFGRFSTVLFTIAD